MKQILLNPEGSGHVLITQALDTRNGVLLTSPQLTAMGDAVVLDLRDPHRGYIVRAESVLPQRKADAEASTITTTSRSKRRT